VFAQEWKNFNPGKDAKFCISIVSEINQHISASPNQQKTLWFKAEKLHKKKPPEFRPEAF